MILKRFYDQKLAQASYLIGCQASGEALVIDANRDAEQYISAARAERVKITHVSETHIHADYVSGTRELAARTGARVYLSAEGGPDWQYAFASDPNVQSVRDGDSFKVGNIKVDIWHTPGHTPEHVIFFITDGAAADKPIAVVTGDFVFVGDVGRPDLLEKAAKVAGTMEAGARQLFQSLERFKKLPDYLQIWPGHGAGSACGKGLSAIPHSTVGYERMFNWAFQAGSEREFVQQVLAGQPDPPRYFAEMKRINRAGPPVLGGFKVPATLRIAELEKLLGEDATIVDTRAYHEFARKHIPGTINIPLDNSFTTWAGWLLSYDRPFYLIIDERKAEEAVRALSMIGLDALTGIFPIGVIDEVAAHGRALESVPQMRVEQLAQAMQAGAVNVVDVRNASEWEVGHLPGVPNIPLGYLTERLDEVPTDKPLVVHCLSGSRSAIAASLLRARGIKDVSNLAGGYQEWTRLGQPTDQSITIAA